MPEVLSLHVQAKGTPPGVFHQPPLPSGESGVKVSVNTGGVASRFTVRSVAFVAKPASLVQEPWKSWPAVSTVSGWSDVQVTGLLIVSPPVVLTVTLLVYQPLLPKVPDETAKVAVGPVLSSLTISGAALVVRPASFVQEPLNGALVVSVVWDWSAVQVVGLLTVSLPEVCTVTSLVYQPFVPGVPAVTDRAAVGGVLSNLNEALAT